MCARKRENPLRFRRIFSVALWYIYAMNANKKTAIFDIDGTIFRSSLLVETVESLINFGVFPEEARKEYETKYRLWIERKGGYEKYIDAVVKTFMKHIRGVHYGDFMDCVEKMVSENKNKVYTYTRDLIKKLKDKKYFLLAISQSPKAVIDKFCFNFGFDKIYGRVYETGPQDEFTGAVVDEHIICNKANIVKRAIEKEGLSLKGSVGVGDTESDIPFLEMVENPICFNPNMKLFRKAKLEGWKIVVERKDVVYEIK